MKSMIKRHFLVHNYIIIKEERLRFAPGFFCDLREGGEDRFYHLIFTVVKDPFYHLYSSTISRFFTYLLLQMVQR